MIHYQDDAVTVHHGDCLDVMRELPDASVDAVCTDPPYGLEFMGREWDKFKPESTGRGVRVATERASEMTPTGVGHEGSKGPYLAARVDSVRVAGAPFQQWCEQWARETLRVLKPGGYMLAFGGTRTWHRLACAIEDAGFEIRDSIHWIYGCLTPDVEVLTDTGWKLGIDVKIGERVAQWNPTDETITLAPVERTYRAPWNGPMRVLRNADTDQLLTPDHRVYLKANRHVQPDVRTWSGWHTVAAGRIGTGTPIKLPVAGMHDGPGIGGADYAALLGWVWTEGGYDRSGTGVRIFQSSVNQDKCDEIAALLDRLGPHKRYDYERTYVRRNGEDRHYTASTWFFSGELAQRVRADLPGKRPTYDLLWRMTTAEKRALLRAAMLGDGTGWGSTCESFFQQYEDDLIWLQTLLALVNRSGKVGMRTNRPGGAVYLRNRATTELQQPHLMRAREERHTGDVWCIGVPTGAFVARRNGMIFITGNSGFPKSLDVSKAIDKAAGAEREVTSTERSPFRMADPKMGTSYMSTVTGDTRETDADGYIVRKITAPATDDARTWQGWGTALKPAHEPIIVARKPLDGTVAANVLAYGTGALNIDECRVDASGRPLRESLGRSDDGTLYGAGLDGSRAVGTTDAGRWPPNVVLSDEAARELDRQSGNRPTGGTDTSGRTVGPGSHGIYGQSGAVETVQYTDTGGASRFFPIFRYEAKAPTSERPTYWRHTCDCEHNQPAAKAGNCSTCGAAFKRESHPTCKPVDLVAWLIRLVVPPGGVCLDPFAGSGTTGEAAILEHKRAILIEREADYLPLIMARLSKPMQVGFDFGDGAA